MLLHVFITFVEFISSMKATNYFSLTFSNFQQ